MWTSSRTVLHVFDEQSMAAGFSKDIVVYFSTKAYIRPSLSCDKLSIWKGSGLGATLGCFLRIDVDL